MRGEKGSSSLSGAGSCVYLWGFSAASPVLFGGTSRQSLQAQAQAPAPAYLPGSCARLGVAVGHDPARPEVIMARQTVLQRLVNARLCIEVRGQLRLVAA